MGRLEGGSRPTAHEKHLSIPASILLSADINDGSTDGEVT